MMSGESFLSSLQQNIGAGVTVAFVNIPFSISVAVASDASPSMGCITAFWAGLISSIFGGSQFNIVGPTIGLSGIITMASVNYGEDVLPLLAIISGLISLLVFFTRMDKLANFVPGNTIQGFRIAVAIIIACNQINFALGLDSFTRHPTFIENVMENLDHVGQTEWQAVVMFGTFLVSQISLSYLFPRVPWIIVIFCVGILCGYLSDVQGLITYKIRTLDSRYPGLSLNLFNFPTFKTDFFVSSTLYSICSGALSVTFVAVLQAVISAKIVDRMTKSRINPRQEVLAVAFANIVSGMFSGIPASAAIARTILNIKSGATSRWAGIYSSLSVFVLTLIFLPYFKYLPLPCIGSILFLAACSMIDFSEIKSVCRNQRHLLIMITVTATCIFVDPASGIILGILLSLGKGAFMESKAWVLCKLRQGDAVLSKFNCDLEVEEKIFTVANAQPFFDKDMLTCCSGSGKKLKSFDERMQDQVFVPSPLPSSKGGGKLREEGAKAEHSAGDGRYHLVLEYKMGGPVNYLTASTHTKRFVDLAVDHVLLNLSHVTEIDIDGVAALEELIRNLTSNKKFAYICGVHRRVRKALEHSEFYESMVEEKLVLRSYKEDKEVFRGEDMPRARLSDAQMALHHLLREHQQQHHDGAHRPEAPQGWGAGPSH